MTFIQRTSQISSLVTHTLSDLGLVDIIYQFAFRLVTIFGELVHQTMACESSVSGIS